MNQNERFGGYFGVSRFVFLQFVAPRPPTTQQPHNPTTPQPNNPTTPQPHKPNQLGPAECAKRSAAPPGHGVLDQALQFFFPASFSQVLISKPVLSSSFQFLPPPKGSPPASAFRRATLSFARGPSFVAAGSSKSDSRTLPRHLPRACAGWYVFLMFFEAFFVDFGSFLGAKIDQKCAGKALQAEKVKTSILMTLTRDFNGLLPKI